MAMDTFARALRNAARMISDGSFSRSIQQVSFQCYRCYISEATSL